ncbi:zinc finger C2HC domain-containing protein 1A-like isoform X1 [Mya arenaria]|uniref:zinc finger C2HC domain-containing protein 1A-like isoform X1 n=1 Tax=Mya arenaria TaxID=6604 RepID=UPI0022E67940|nr:zinc finger C2HC domain-containing protein 1A-like isoform X1 [Mya arenaria]
MDGRNVKLDLRPCRTCGRTFVPESLKKHEASCKNVQKKRKPFDASKQRATEDLSLKQIKQAQKKNVAPPKSNWRSQHQEFISNIRAAKGAQVAMERGDPLPPPPPPSLNPDYVTCPHCARRFNEKAAERHISFCQEQQKRINVNKKREPSQQEKARAAAAKYQPPKPKLKSQMDSPSGPTSGGYGASRGGYSSGSPAGRAGPGASSRAPPPGASKSDVGRSPAGSTGRGGAAAPRGRAPQQGYAASKYSEPSKKSPSPRVSGPSVGPSSISLQARGRAAPTRDDMQDNRPVPRVTRAVPRHTNTQMDTSNGHHSNAIKTRPVTGAAKFCHECGSRYPTPQVKFCMECGLKRLEVPIR